MEDAAEFGRIRRLPYGPRVGAEGTFAHRFLTADYCTVD